MTFAKHLLCWGFVPFLLLGINGLGLFLVRHEYSHGYLFLLFLSAILLSFFAERILPYEKVWNEDHRDRTRDFFHGLVNEGLNCFSLVLIPFLMPYVSYEGNWPKSWPIVLQVLLAVFIFDFGITLCHFASHKIEFLWRFHAVHHCVERMYGFNGLMKHPIHQLIEGSCGIVPLVLLGIPNDVTIALIFCTTIQLLLQHSNVDYRIGPFKYILALNQAHRFHHQKWAGIGDVNFGLFTSLWDHMLGTFTYDENKTFTSKDLGIGLRPDYPTSYMNQLTEPFRGHSSRSEHPVLSEDLSKPS